MFHYLRRKASALFVVATVAGCDTSVIAFTGEAHPGLPDGLPTTTAGGFPTTGVGGASGDAAPDGPIDEGKPETSLPPCSQDCAEGPCSWSPVEPRTIATGPFLHAINGLALGTDRLYFGSASPDRQGDVRYVPFAGSDVTIIATNVQVMELLVDGSSVYFVDDTRGNSDAGSLRTLKSVGTNGGAVQTIASDENLASVSLDSAYVYYAAGVAFGVGNLGALPWRIVRLPRGAPDGSTPEVVVETQYWAGIPLGFVVDDTHLYWTASDANGGNLFRRPLAGGETTTLATATSPEVIGGPSLHGGYVYFFFGAPAAAPCWGAVARVPKAGGEVERISYGNTGAPSMQSGLAIDDTFVYWLRAYGADGWLFRAPIAGGSPEVLSKHEDVGLPTTSKSMAATATNVYWITQGRPADPDQIRTFSK